MLIPLDASALTGLAATVIRHSLPCDYCKATLESFCRRCGRRLRETEYVSRLAYTDTDVFCGACGEKRHLGTCTPIDPASLTDGEAPSS